MSSAVTTFHNLLKKSIQVSVAEMPSAFISVFGQSTYVQIKLAPQRVPVAMNAF